MWVIFFAGKCCNYQKLKRKKKIHQDKIKETKIAMFSPVKSGLVDKIYVIGFNITNRQIFVH